MKTWPDLDLKAGRFSLKLSGGTIRYLLLDGSEVIRCLYFALRDKNWGTIPEELISIDTDIKPNVFEINYETRYRDADQNIDFVVKGRISGMEDAVVKWKFDGIAENVFERNRIGFCLLHPASAAGQPCKVVHCEGTSENSIFPELISPHQPFMDIQSIEYGGVISEFEGDVFEMEDQRNWTDASYKTYSTPIGLPFPVEIARNDSVSQLISFKIISREDRPSVEASTSQSLPCRIFGLSKDSQKLLDIGWVYSGKLSAGELDLVKNLPDGHVRLDVRPNMDEDFVVRAVADIEKAGKELLPFLHVDNDTPDSFYLEALKSANCGRLAIVGCQNLKIVPVERIEPLIKAIRNQFGNIPVAAGSDAFFTEFNRNRISPEKADAFVFSINPQVHAFDNLSITETLEGQEAVVKTALAICGGKPVWVSPVTLNTRWNPNATAEEMVPQGELPTNVDIRQLDPFCACWTLASIGRMSKAGAALSTYYELSGWKGLFEKEAGSKIPQKFPSRPLQVFPVYKVLTLLRGFEGGTLTVRDTDNPLVACAYRVAKDEQTIDILINLSDKAERFKVEDSHFDKGNSSLCGWNSHGEAEFGNKPRTEGDTVFLPGHSVLTSIDKGRR
jgi:D-apionolactonase